MSKEKQKISSTPTIGDKILVKTHAHEEQGTLLESYDSKVLLIKLDSGYNIGIPKEDVLKIKVLEKYKEKPESKEEKKREMKKELPNIAMIITGGTISSSVDIKTGAVKPLTSVKKLFQFYPEIFNIVNVKAVEAPFMVLSENISYKEWKALAKVVKKYLDDSTIQGIIITHGTDTLHYTSAALSFFLKNINKPVVLTYAQRSIDRGSSDANLNLVCAAKTAISDIAQVVIVGHGETNDNFCYIYPGAKTRKMHSSRRDAFKAINTTPIARVFPDNQKTIEILSSYKRKNAKEKPELDISFNENIALIKFYPNQNPDILDYYIKNNYKGIILEGTGFGHVSIGREAQFNWLPKIREAIKKNMIICMTTQTIFGKTDPFIYSTGRELEKAGVCYLKDMLPETALIKLSWILGHKKWQYHKTVKELMLKDLAGEFSERLIE
jgi:glutamyl-tRNA(Gln) amidotransferase subunit D